MKRGLVIGKFYPPHLGHSYLINHALEHSDELYVLVCDDKRQKIDAHKRRDWLQEIHRNAKVLVIPDIGKDDDSHAWAEHTKSFLGFTPDTVFTSENYGVTYAKELGCVHDQVDLERVRVPISSTRIRNDLMNNLYYLHPLIRKNFILRVVVLGAESTGTTTLSKDLARYYTTNMVQEYGRYFSESVHNVFEYVWTDRDFEHIALMQNQMEDVLAETAHKVLICDTDSFATSIWQKRYMGHMTQRVQDMSKGRVYDLYILTGDEIPFVQDGMRDGEHVRHVMHTWFEKALTGKRYIAVRGDREERLRSAIIEIDKLIEEKNF